MSEGTETIAQHVTVERRKLSGWLRDQLRNIAPFITLLFLVIFFSSASSSFSSWDNVGNILT